MNASVPKLVGFKPCHLLTLKPQPAQAHISGLWDACREAQNHPTVSWVSDRVLGCAGLVRTNGRSIFWAVFSEMGPRAFLKVHNDIAMLIAHTPDERMETYVA